MLSGLHGLHSYFGMEKRGQNNVNDVDLRVCQQLMIVLRHLFIPIALLHFSGQLQVQIAHRFQANGDAAHLFIAISVQIGGVSCSYGSNGNNTLFHVNFPRFLNI